MIAEDHVSYEVAKLLKEKGFDVELQCYSYDAVTKENVDIYWQKNINGLLPRCTHQMVRRWLRKAHKIYADPIQQGNYDDNSIYYTYIVAQIIDGKSYIHRPMSVVDKLSYEEADEAALKYPLENLI